MADTKASDFPVLTAPDYAADRVPILDMSLTGASRNKTILARNLVPYDWQQWAFGPEETIVPETRNIGAPPRPMAVRKVRVLALLNGNFHVSIERVGDPLVPIATFNVVDSHRGEADVEFNLTATDAINVIVHSVSGYGGPSPVGLQVSFLGFPI
jgi:hypothetical protein